jgi:DNA-binding response OmpR family regulator
VYALISTVRECQRFRALPILVMGQGELIEKINVLSVGADGLLLKPIKLDELKVKIQALFRRSMSYQTSIDDIVYKNLKLSPLSGEAFIGDNKVEFTETEFKLLEALIIEKGRPVRRELLANRSLSSRNKNLRTIDVHINSIRGKLGQIGRKIKTLRGKGYMLVD